MQNLSFGDDEWGEDEEVGFCIKYKTKCFWFMVLKLY